MRGILLWGMLLQPMALPVTLPVLLMMAAYNGIRNRSQMFYEAWLGLVQVSTVAAARKKTAPGLPGMPVDRSVFFPG